MNAASDERMTILRMIENNKITAEQGAQLLSAMGKAGDAVAPPAPVVDNPPQEQPLPTGGASAASRTRRFRVLVTDTVTGKNKVSVNLPLNLVRWGMRVGKNFSSDLDGIDMDQLADMLEGEESGQFIEVIDEEDGEQVRVFIE